MGVQVILKTVLAEHEETQASSTILETLEKDVETKLKDVGSISEYSEASEQLTLVSFRCMLQDTGYPMEVYMPAGAGESEGAIDMSQLRERWIGWAVEIPGEQKWATSTASPGNGQVTSTGGHLPKEVHQKFPLPGNEGRYLGALVKVYVEDVTFKPASVHTFIGILSTAALPSAIGSSEEDAEVIVPAIHVIRVEPESTPAPFDSLDIPEGLIEYLSTAFTPPDRLAAELVLLSLLSSPTARPNALPPLGTLSLNLTRKDPQTTANLDSIISSLTPRLVSQFLSLSLLHSHPFSPSSTDSTLDSGLLQLAPSTVLVVREDEMGQGGQLQEKAIKNLRALMECARDQMVRYEYPYMDGLKMECAIRIIMLSEGKSLVPVDVNLPIASDGPAQHTDPTNEQLAGYRAYLASRSHSSHAAKFNIPDDVAQAIQDDFVSRRKDSTAAEEGLKRRMRLARLMAIATESATLSQQVWNRVLDLDRRIESRLTAPTPAP